MLLPEVFSRHNDFRAERTTRTAFPGNRPTPPPVEARLAPPLASSPQQEDGSVKAG
jgi:hypothetical protein